MLASTLSRMLEVLAFHGLIVAVDTTRTYFLDQELSGMREATWNLCVALAVAGNLECTYCPRHQLEWS